MLHFIPLPAIPTLSATLGSQSKVSVLNFHCAMDLEAASVLRTPTSKSWDLAAAAKFLFIICNKQTNGNTLVLAVTATTSAIHTSLFHNNPLPPPMLFNLVLSCPN